MKRNKPIDMEAVRASMRRLDEIVLEHPELTCGELRVEKNVAAWEAILREDEQTMAANKLTAFRLPEEFLRAIDEYAKRMEREHPGVAYNRTDAIRRLIAIGLERENAALAPSPGHVSASSVRDRRRPARRKKKGR